MTNRKVEIIAEVGVNHNGSLERAKQLVDAGVAAGVDVIKFQTFNAESLATPLAEMASYQQKNTGRQQSQLAMLKEIELPLPAFVELQEYCHAKGVEFMSSPFDDRSLDFLVSELNVKRLKIASGEISNAPLLLKFGRSQCPLILSTGMASGEDIDRALAVIAFGIKYPDREPGSLRECQLEWAQPETQRRLRERVTLLHCTSQYPAPLDQVNLRVMGSMAERWGLPIGYSDHTEGIDVAIAATALGATVIEKHFTLDKTLEGPDHRASLEPSELAALVISVRAVSAALGSKNKQIQNCEENTRAVARKSLVASEIIQKGELFTSDNLQARRPGTGVSPMQYWDILGRESQSTYCAGEVIDE